MDYWMVSKKCYSIRIKTKKKQNRADSQHSWALAALLFTNLQSTVTICQTNALNVNVILAYVNYFSEYPHLASTYKTFLAQNSRDS